MTELHVALVLGAPVGAPADVDRSPGEAACSVSVFALDPQGRVLSTRTASASRTPAMLFRGRAAQVPDGSPPLLFDVFSPGGQRYQVLLGTTRGRPLLTRGGSAGSSPPLKVT